MALGYTTYKTPNAIFRINEDLTGKEGCGVLLSTQGQVNVATGTAEIPYGIIVVGGESVDGTYAPGFIGGSAIEFVDQIGCVVQVTIASTNAVYAGDFLLIDSNDANGTFVSTYHQPAAVNDWIWGIALTDVGPGEQCLMRFQPYKIQYVAP
jgi:hypothetical protein